MSSDSYENLRYEIRESAAWITIHRPDKLNALNRRTVEELVAARQRALSDHEVRVLVVSGAGTKAFVAGADIAEMTQLGAADAQEFSRFLQASLDTLERSPKPVIAAVNGFALGGGCELAMACHLRIASESARFGQPEVSLGLIPGAGGTQRLQRLVGRGRALALILSGETIEAIEAQRIGLVNAVHPPDRLDGAVAELVRTLAAKSPLALARALAASIGSSAGSLEEGLRLEAALFGLCFATEDMREGTRAFMEKRKPRFVGR